MGIIEAVILAFGIELGSLIGSAAIIKAKENKKILKYPNKGYKIDFKKLEHLEDEEESTLDSIAMVVPFLNMLYFLFKKTEIERLEKNNPEFQSVLLPISPIEKVMYNKIDNDKDRLLFLKSIFKNPIDSRSEEPDDFPFAMTDEELEELPGSEIEFTNLQPDLGTTRKRTRFGRKQNK